MEVAAPAAAPAPVATAARSGEEVYNAQCAMCHATGAAGAPKFGNAAEWGPRAATGIDALMQSALNGKNAMPPRGLCATCSDDELQAAVEYMVNNSK
jgi:cytochrome c5